MASVDLETIQQDLARRFAAPLPEFYQRRILFWYDEEREFEDQIGELALDGVTVLALTGSNRGDRHNRDILINSAFLGVEGTAEYLEELIQKKYGSGEE